MSGIDAHYAARRTASGGSNASSLKRQAPDDDAALSAKKRKGDSGNQRDAPLRAKSVAELRNAEPHFRRGVESPSKRLKKARSTIARPVAARSAALPGSRSASAASGSRLGFLASSASVVKNTITAIGRRLSAGPETLLKLDEVSKNSNVERKSRSRGSIDNIRALLSRSRSEADILYSKDKVEEGMETMTVPRIMQRKSTDLSGLHSSTSQSKPKLDMDHQTLPPQAPLLATAPATRPVSTASYGSSARLSALNMATGLPAPAASLFTDSLPRNRVMRKSSRLVAPTPRASTSTLRAPTASSLARMQATVKPSAAPSLSRASSFVRPLSLGPASVANNNGFRTSSHGASPFVFPTSAPIKPSASSTLSLKQTSAPSSSPLPRVPGAASNQPPLPIASAFMANRTAVGAMNSPLKASAARSVKYAPKPATPRRAVAGGINSPAKALKHKQSHATLAMAAKQQEILERRRMFQNQRMMNSVL